MADSKGQKPEPDEPELPGGDSNQANPFEELNFGEPLEELDFTEPSELAGAAASGEVAPESGAAEEFAAAESEMSETADTVYEAAAIGGQEAGEEIVEPALAGEGLPDVGEEAEAAEEAEGAETPAKKRPKWLAHLEWLGVALVVLAIWAITTLITVHSIWNAAYLVLLALIPYVMWKTRGAWTDPQITAVYTLMLAVSVAFLLTAVYWLGLELLRYDLDIKAKEARTPAGIAQSL